MPTPYIPHQVADADERDMLLHFRGNVFQHFGRLFALRPDMSDRNAVIMFEGIRFDGFHLFGNMADRVGVVEKNMVGDRGMPMFAASLPTTEW